MDPRSDRGQVLLDLVTLSTFTLIVISLVFTISFDRREPVFKTKFKGGYDEQRRQQLRESTSQQLKQKYPGNRYDEK